MSEEVKIRTGEQVEREQQLLFYKSKAQITSILIDTEQKLEEQKKLNEEHQKINGELREENKRLKEHCFCNRTDCSGRIKDSRKFDSVVQKYEKLEENWEELKKWISANDEHYPEAIPFRETIRKMQELESSDSDE